MVRGAVLGWVAAVALVAARPARADTYCAAPPGGPHLAGIDARARLSFVTSSLDRGARRARIWAWTWAGLYSGVVTYSLIRIGTDDADHRIDDIIGASAGAVGIAALAVSPLKVMGDQRRLERRLRLRPDEDVCATLSYAERLFVRDAASEKFGRSPLIHVGNFVFNTGLALLLGLGFGHWDQAAITGLVGVAVGELQFATQPTDVIGALDRYRDGDFAHPKPAAHAFSIAPMLGRDRIGLQVGFTW